jgi:hypothetical protein
LAIFGDRRARAAVFWGGFDLDQRSCSGTLALMARTVGDAELIGTGGGRPPEIKRVATEEAEAAQVRQATISRG